MRGERLPTPLPSSSIPIPTLLLLLVRPSSTASQPTTETTATSSLPQCATQYDPRRYDYAAGDRTFNYGKNYVCKRAPFDIWCDNESYAPGSSARWSEAWTLLHDECQIMNIKQTTTTTTSQQPDSDKQSYDMFYYQPLNNNNNNNNLHTETKEEKTTNVMEEKSTRFNNNAYNNNFNSNDNNNNYHLPDCTPPYNTNANYNEGEMVSVNGRNYECKPFPQTPWCSIDAYAPGSSASWSLAWTPLDACHQTQTMQGMTYNQNNNNNDQQQRPAAERITNVPTRRPGRRPARRPTSVMQEGSNANNGKRPYNPNEKGKRLDEAKDNGKRPFVGETRPRPDSSSSNEDEDSGKRPFVGETRPRPDSSAEDDDGGKRPFAGAARPLPDSSSNEDDELCGPAFRSNRSYSSDDVASVDGVNYLCTLPRWCNMPKFGPEGKYGTLVWTRVASCRGSNNVGDNESDSRDDRIDGGNSENTFNESNSVGSLSLGTDPRGPRPTPRPRRTRRPTAKNKPEKKQKPNGRPGNTSNGRPSGSSGNTSSNLDGESSKQQQGSCPGAWVNGYPYAEGDKVGAKGQVYKCKGYPQTGWCGASTQYEPVTGAVWKMAWDTAGSCGEEEPSASVPNDRPSSGGNGDNKNNNNGSSSSSNFLLEGSEDQPCPSLWANEYNYAEGDLVGASGRVYRCRGYPFTAWCGLSRYRPGVGTIWDMAWNAVAYCDGRQATQSPTPRPTKTPKPNRRPSDPTRPSNSASYKNDDSTAHKVFDILDDKQSLIDGTLFLYQGSAPSTVYRYEGFVAGLRIMFEDGVAGKHFYLGNSDPTNGHLYGLANIAAFIGQSMKETIQYDACDENSWDYYNMEYPLSNACGQLGQSYQDYHCPEHQRHMECGVDPKMSIRATTHAKWYGAPGPMYCGPKEEYPQTGIWDYTYACHNPWADPPESCDVYEGQKAGRYDNSRAVPNRNGRTDVEGCCWWGRGVIQTTGVCNFGKLNYFLGKRAADDGRVSRYPKIDFCKDPGIICSSKEHKELKWIAGMFYWIESLQSYNERGWNYIDELHKFVDGGMSDHSFINGVSGVVNRGCHDPPCGTGPVDGAHERAGNFQKVLTTLR